MIRKDQFVPIAKVQTRARDLIKNQFQLEKLTAFCKQDDVLNIVLYLLELQLSDILFD